MPVRARRDLTNDEAPGAGKPWEQGEGGSFGSWLRQQREIRNINLREISDNTKIGMRYLEALEEDRFEVLPAPIFAKGFLREYAKYVGLDADEVVNYYLAAEQRRRAELGVEEPVVPAPRPSTRPAVVPDDKLKKLGWVAAAVVALLLLALAVWLVRRGGSETAEAPPSAIAPPVSASIPSPPPAVSPPPAPAADGPFVVNMSFTAECWVEAVVDGSRRISELRVQGESMRIEARESVVLTLGNAGSVRVDVNGNPVRLTSAPGQVVRDLVIDRAAAGLPPLPAPPGPQGGQRPPRAQAPAAAPAPARPQAQPEAVSPAQPATQPTTQPGTPG